MLEGPVDVHAPDDGVWRIGRGSTPLAKPDQHEPLVISHSGHRFDSPSGSYGVLYFGSTLEVCFGETLARFRPSPAVVAAIGDDWRRKGFMDLGAVAADWRFRRSAAHVTLPNDANFLDIESATTHQFLRTELASGLAALGHDDLDVSTVRGPDRRVTRMISEWAAVQSDEEGYAYYSGIRYLSRLDSKWECSAVFDDVEVTVLETRPIVPRMEGLREVAELYGLTVH